MEGSAAAPAAPHLGDNCCADPAVLPAVQEVGAARIAKAAATKSAVAAVLEQEGIPEEEIQAVEQRVSALQQQFQEHVERQRRRRIDAIRTVYPNITDAEAELALTACGNDDAEVLARLAGPNSEALWQFICPVSAAEKLTARKQNNRSGNPEAGGGEGNESPASGTVAGMRTKTRKKAKSGAVSSVRLGITLDKDEDESPAPSPVTTTTPILAELGDLDAITEVPPFGESGSRSDVGRVGLDEGRRRPQKRKRNLEDDATGGYGSSGDSNTAAAADPEGDLDNITYPLELPSCNTVILSLGRLHKIADNDWWASPTRSLYYHPYPLGFHAQKMVWDRLFDMFIDECPLTGKPVFRVGFASTDKWFQGYTPTDPWTKWCLEQSKNGNSRASGPAFYGFSDKVLQYALRRLVIRTDVHEYRYRMGDSGITDSEFSPPSVKVDDFSPDERRILVAQVSLLAADSKGRFHWGAVAAALPRRPGYLCQLEYNRLCRTREVAASLPVPGVNVKDPYVPADQLTKGLGNSGGGRKKKGEARTVDQSASKKRSSRGRPPGRVKGRARTGDSDDGDESGVAGDGGPDSEPDPDNPCPDKRDSVTFSRMRVPTVCPCGYVCDYSTWLRVLSGGTTLNENLLFAEDRENQPPEGPKDTCPFTKQHHTRRMLVKLTIDNWAEWEGKIRDV